MNRRSFVNTLGTALAGVALRPRFLLAPRRLARVGLELYTVREAMHKDPEGTLAAVHAIGYTDVELLWSFNNFDRTPQQVRASLNALGLRAPSAHIAPEILLKDWERSLDTANFLGHEYLIVPSLPDDTQHSLDAWRRWADHFNTAGAAARKAGLWLAFHNEPEHMKPVDGKVPYDLFIEHTDPAMVRLQLDMGNMALGGGNPMQYLQRHRDRYWSFHIKDVVADGSHDTELGAGSLDIRGFLAAIPELDRKPCYVEQESPTDALASARRDYTFLQGLDF